MFFCFICDQIRKVKSAKPVQGLCPRCGGQLSNARVKTECRFCFIPVCCSSHHEILCTRCGAQIR
ncbi:hypothetical protein O6H91_13G100300 [Diphasiastrum complanatum]|uniref:Uncharacterized protein n=2 Tax=Diphasiastrum complanatum TaxID=34168 RepID=A0ACC2BXU6_DIPCM|nr:hypothetical protein O6H91_13G098600 [Diphasiastrum complanatum]KAJ7534571.1 hypothetical protein O6H91_13G100300 [Diphasiastrum complanatum]